MCAGLAAAPLARAGNVMYSDMKASYLNLTPKRIAIVSFIIGILPLIPTLIALAVIEAFGIHLTEGNSGVVPFSGLLGAMTMCFWGAFISFPIATLGFVISAIWSLCIPPINSSRRSNAKI